jgi:hypothetical protein
MFTDAKLASQVGAIIMVFPTSISVLLAIEAGLPLGHEQTARTIIQCLYFLPWFPFEVLALECVFKGGAMGVLGLNPKWAWLALALQPFVYFMCYLYLDNVIPNAFGISRDCFYCLRKTKIPEADTDDSLIELTGDSEREFDP